MLFIKGEFRDYTRPKKTVVLYSEQTAREKHFSSGERQLGKPASGAAAAKGKSKGKRKKETVEIPYIGQQKVNALEETSVERITFQRRGESKRGRKEFATVQLSTAEFPGKRTQKGKSPSAKEDHPTRFALKKGDCPRGNACDYWHPPECSFYQQTELQT